MKRAMTLGERLSRKFGVDIAQLVGESVAVMLEGPMVESHGQTKEVLPGVGLDVGTAFLVSARRVSIGDRASVEYRSTRDAFLDVTETSKISVDALKRAGVSMLAVDARTLVVGAQALKLAAVLQQEARRPLQRGIISQREADAIPVLLHITETLLGKPLVKNELVKFSTPAPLRGDATWNVVWHTKVFDKILRKLGYVPSPLTEGLAASYGLVASSKSADFAITVSMGAGMCNVAVTYLTIPLVEFSLPYGGDWLDANVAASVDLPVAICTGQKEQPGFDLGGQSQIEEAYAAYYSSLLKALFSNVREALVEARCADSVMSPALVSLVGGTTLPAGFEKLAQQEIAAARLPVEVEGVKTHQDAEKIVARGLLAACISL